MGVGEVGGLGHDADQDCEEAGGWAASAAGGFADAFRAAFAVLRVLVVGGLGSAGCVDRMAIGR